MIHQILNPEFLLLQAMPSLALVLGLIAIDITFIGKKRRIREAAPEKQARL